jgi:hypothetical protein
MYDPDWQRLVVGAMVLETWCEANGGHEPCTIWQYKRVARRLGVRIHWLPENCDVQAMCRRGDRPGHHGVIYIRKTHNMAKLRLEFLHELGEAATYWEGHPPFVCGVSRHETACAAVLLLLS